MSVRKGLAVVLIVAGIIMLAGEGHGKTVQPPQASS
jgi:hypothetical protein